jgi:hypothetical protein
MSASEVFELEMLGGAFERRYRRMRPEVAEMPWGTLDPSRYPPEVILAARRAWTGAAFQEHRTGVACTATLRALIEVRAPLDLIALASRFPLDEMVHVELCARMAMELGGGTEIIHEPDGLVVDADPRFPPLVRAAELVTRFFCVGEALSIPMLRGTWHAAAHPLAKAVLGRIVKDEAAHGTFGFTFLDWALPHIEDDAAAMEHLARQADRAIDAVTRQWDDLRTRPKAPSLEANPLGWMQTDEYLDLAQRSLESKVREPLLERGYALVPRNPDGSRK